MRPTISRPFAKLRINVVLIRWSVLTTLLVILLINLWRAGQLRRPVRHAELAIHRQGAGELSSLLVAIQSTAR
jgi:hypothetical protein